MGTDFPSVFTCIRACFIEESTASPPIFNSEFSPLLNAQWWQKDHSILSLIYWVTQNDNDYKGSFQTINYILIYFLLARHFLTIREIEDYFTVLWCFFQLLLWQKYWELSGTFLQPFTWDATPKVRSCKACNKLKLDFLSSINEKTKSIF